MGTQTEQPGTHCEWCGADFEPGAEPPRPQRPVARPPAPAEGTEPATHCEWCGAEYPQPGETDSTG
jgi:predicted nucleic acid-binding Zn ribbon protein